jgi:trehalose synthase
MRRKLSTYEPIVGTDGTSPLKQLAADLKGARVVHVNSTREGGGVAEILQWLIPLMNDLGLEASWETITGHDEFFRVTKAFHNALQGNTQPLTNRMLSCYREVQEENA